MLNLDPVIIDEALTFLNSDCEMNGFYYVCGWAVKKVLCKSSCSFCTDILTNSNPHGLLFRSNAILTLTKLYEKILFGLICPTPLHIFVILHLLC